MGALYGRWRTAVNPAAVYRQVGRWGVAAWWMGGGGGGGRVGPCNAGPRRCEPRKWVDCIYATSKTCTGVCLCLCVCVIMRTRALTAPRHPTAGNGEAEHQRRRARGACARVCGCVQARACMNAKWERECRSGTRPYVRYVCCTAFLFTGALPTPYSSASSSSFSSCSSSCSSPHGHMLSRRHAATIPPTHNSPTYPQLTPPLPTHPPTTHPPTHNSRRPLPPTTPPTPPKGDGRPAGGQRRARLRGHRRGAVPEQEHAHQGEPRAHTARAHAHTHTHTHTHTRAQSFFFPFTSSTPQAHISSLVR